MTLKKMSPFVCQIFSVLRKIICFPHLKLINDHTFFKDISIFVLVNISSSKKKKKKVN